MKNELKEYCESIKADIKKLYEADITDEEREELEANGEPADLWEYFADALDIEYTVSSDGQYLGARIYVTLGGPNVWVDTRRGEVAGAWGCDRASAWLPSEICEAIDEIFSELFEGTIVRGRA